MALLCREADERILDLEDELKERDATISDLRNEIRDLEREAA